jgi:hypothetical protein
MRHTSLKDYEKSLSGGEPVWKNGETSSSNLQPVVPVQERGRRFGPIQSTEPITFRFPTSSLTMAILRWLL